MSLRERLASGGFAVTAEISPPRGASIDKITQTAAQRAGDLRLLHRPVDHRRWGQSSWLNYWQGRDEGLWTGNPRENP